jgi:hypothetical protein
MSYGIGASHVSELHERVVLCCEVFECARERIIKIDGGWKSVANRKQIVARKIVVAMVNINSDKQIRNPIKKTIPFTKKEKYAFFLREFYL